MTISYIRNVALDRPARRVAVGDIISPSRGRISSQISRRRKLTHLDGSIAGLDDYPFDIIDSLSGRIPELARRGVG